MSPTQHKRSDQVPSPSSLLEFLCVLAAVAKALSCYSNGLQCNDASRGTQEACYKTGSQYNADVDVDVVQHQRMLPPLRLSL